MEIESLKLGDAICKSIAELGDYDFNSDISVNILGHIFEQSITDLEEIKRRYDPKNTRPEEIGSKRRIGGIFYTPPLITEHIVEQAVGKWLADRKAELGFNTLRPLTEEDFASIRLKNRGRRASRYEERLQSEISDRLLLASRERSVRLPSNWAKPTWCYIRL